MAKTTLNPSGPNGGPTGPANSRRGADGNPGPVLAFRDISHAYMAETVGGARDGGVSLQPVLSGVNLSLAAGSFHFLTGPSGAGKSTLLKLMYMGLEPSQGRIELFGKDVLSLPRGELPRLRRRIGVVFQDFRLLPHLSIVENVALPLRLAGASPAQIGVHVPELLRWVGLGDHLDATPQTLSGGQQQRVAIARAVINRPALLLADEPTGNVDDEIGYRLMHLFVELNKLGTTVVIATHNQHLIERINKPILTLKNGKVERVK